jgi:sulfate permease, SulP family
VSGLPRHDPNQELMAQGVANAIVPFFGGMPATGTIARTITNVRAGATTPVAGIVHAVTLAIVVLVAAPLALYVPLAVLAGVLLFVAWNMGEWRAFAHLRRLKPHARVLMVGTFLLTVIFDLTVAVQVGLIAACAFFIRQMSTLLRIEQVPAPAGELRWLLHGSLFFGAVAKVDPVVQAIEAGPERPLVTLDALHLVHLDTSGLDALEQLRKAVKQRGGTLRLLHVQAQPREVLARAGFPAEPEPEPATA